MASKGCLRYLRQINGLTSQQQSRLANTTRSMATTSDIPSSAPSTTVIKLQSEPEPQQSVLTTVYSFPRMEPLHFAYYPQSHLYLPLRKDILHKAVIYEGDKTRQGTASTKWRDDVHGSHRKHHPQKGLGMARAGDKQSPIFRGGGVVFGPHPRDFSTKLNKKIYDLAWRTALSHRYKRGELVVVDRIRNLKSNQAHWIKQVFEGNSWGNASKRSLLVALEQTKANEKLFKGMDAVGEEGRILEVSDVDVKDLLELGRVVIEYDALNKILNDHASDLGPSFISGSPSSGSPSVIV